MTATHALAGRTLRSFDDLLPFPAVMQRDELPSPAFVSDEYAAFRCTVQVRFRSDDIDLIKRVLCAGLGVGVCTSLAFRQEIASGELAWVPLASERLMRRRIGLYVPARRTLSPACDGLVHILTERLEQL